MFDEVVIALGSNSKKEEYFSLEERLIWIKEVFKNEAKVSVEKYEGLTVDFCEKIGADFIIEEDYETQAILSMKKGFLK